MDNNLQQAINYVQQQLASGQTPDTIAGQLRAAGWQDDLIKQVFDGLSVQVQPTSPLQTQTASTPLPSAGTGKGGRIRTGWRLLKASFTILQGNKSLLRYLLMTGVVAFVTTLVFVGIYLLLDPSIYDSSQTYEEDPTIIGYLLLFANYVVISFIVHFYAAGLTANVFDIFKGNKKPYKEYISVARSKALPILVFSVVDSIVGLFLRYVVERIRFVGWLLYILLGAAWSLGTTFVIPLIVSKDKPNGLREVKESIVFFKQTWGESITAKAGVGIPIFFIQIALFIVWILLFILVINVGNVPLIIAGIILYLIASFIVAVIGIFANNLVNIALFYYATEHQVPPAFSSEMLNDVFRKRGPRWWKKDKAA